MKNKRAIFLVLFLFASAGCSMLISSSATEHKSGCVFCHTDGDLIKQMYKPPKIDFKTDEGVG